MDTMVISTYIIVSAVFSLYGMYYFVRNLKALIYLNEKRKRAIKNETTNRINDTFTVRIFGENSPNCTITANGIPVEVVSIETGIEHGRKYSIYTCKNRQYSMILCDAKDLIKVTAP